MNFIKKPTKKWSWTDTIVVLFVLLIAASLVLPGPRTLGAARRATTVDRANQIDVACQSYKTEYGTLPPTSENYRLVKILCGDNPRGIPFISLKKSQLNANGEIFDPWGTPFRITFDSDSKVHVISAGPDKIFGTADDITNQ